jgi:hypothetical protein
MTLHDDIERFDLISDQLESFKKVILNMVILMKNLRDVNQTTTNIQVIRILSIELTDIFQNYRTLRNMNVTILSSDEIEYIDYSTRNFLNVILHNFQ